MKKLAIALSSCCAFGFASYAYAGFGGVHHDTRVTKEVVHPQSSTTKRHVVVEHHQATDTTHEVDVTRVHPVIHEHDVDRYLHHVIRRDFNEHATQHENEAPQVERDQRTVHEGHAAPNRSHTVVKYHDVYRDVNKTVVHNHNVTNYDDHYHKLINDVISQPIVHEHDVEIDRVENTIVPRRDVRHETVNAAARVIVDHKRVDIDP